MSGQGQLGTALQDAGSTVLAKSASFHSGSGLLSDTLADTSSSVGSWPKLQLSQRQRKVNVPHSLRRPWGWGTLVLPWGCLRRGIDWHPAVLSALKTQMRDSNTPSSRVHIQGAACPLLLPSSSPQLQYQFAPQRLRDRPLQGVAA